jgi:hypothetical protein
MQTTGAIDAGSLFRVVCAIMQEQEPIFRTLSLCALACAAAVPFVVAIGACGGGNGPAASPSNGIASVSAPASTSAAPTDSGSAVTSSTGPASAMPTASQPSSITSKKTMRKKSPELLVCHKDYQPQTHGHDIAADVKREATMCQDASGMHAVGDVHTFKGKKDSDVPDTFTFHAKAGKCYRAFAESGPGIDDLDLVIKDSDRNVAGEDSTDDPNPIALEDGAVCFNVDDDAVVGSTIGSGHGDYVVSLWSDE